MADPPTISLDSALSQVADGLDNMRKKTAPRDKFGLIVDEVEVTFNVSAKATEEGQLGVSASIPTGGATLGFTGSDRLVNEGSRGNTIVIKFKNIATADLSKGDRRMVDQCLRKNPPKGCVIILNDPRGGATE